MNSINSWTHAIFAIDRDDMTKVVHAVFFDAPPTQADYIGLYEELETEYDLNMSDILLVPGTDKQIADIKTMMAEAPEDFHVELHGTKEQLN
jgi:hypothetical protein